MVEVDSLVKTYPGPRGRSVRALAGVSFVCHPGEVFGLLGRNGAGKTTALRVLATILTPTAGTARVMGHDVATDGARVRRQLGFLTGDTRLYDRLSPKEALRYFGRLQGIDGPAARRRIGELADRFDLNALLDRRIGTLSTGQKQRVSLARALLHDPAVVVLDEPTTGLDVLGARDTLDLVATLRDEGRTVIFSTHILSEVHRLCDRVAVVEGGRLLACEPTAMLAARHHGDLEEAFLSLVRSGTPGRPGQAGPEIKPLPAVGEGGGS
jgi:sodium transport system ATP-binding protein